MLRDKSLVPLSHQHQHVLALCVRIDRAMQIARHFSVEEQEVFPVAMHYIELHPLIEELLADHAILRALFSRADAHQLNFEELEMLVERLALHIRREERGLFEEMQRVMSTEELASLGVTLTNVLADAPKTCSLRSAPNPPTGS
jgi:hemerythrin-like domain-containing protein